MEAIITRLNCFNYFVFVLKFEKKKKKKKRKYFLRFQISSDIKLWVLKHVCSEVCMMILEDTPVVISQSKIRLIKEK